MSTLKADEISSFLLLLPIMYECDVRVWEDAMSVLCLKDSVLGECVDWAAKAIKVAPDPPVATLLRHYIVFDFIRWDGGSDITRKVAPPGQVADLFGNKSSFCAFCSLLFVCS
jgi:hypothetical protein